jgi:hypothetical protein
MGIASAPQEERFQLRCSVVVSIWRSIMVRLRRPAAFRRIAGSYQFIVGLFVAAVFLVSSLPHLTNPYYFLSSVYDYKLVGATNGEAVAIVIPFLQILISACLLLRVYVGGALLASSGLFAVFTYVHASVIYRSMTISCGCFGPRYVAPIGKGSLLFVVALLVASITGYACFLFSRSPIIGLSHESIQVS